MASILLIDDDNDLRTMTAEILREAGHPVNDAPDGKTGLALYDAGQHDLIITDIVMPAMEGLELIAGLRHATPRPRIIAISGDSQFSGALYLPAAIGLGVQLTLLKPVRPDALLAAVAVVLAAPAPPTVPRSQQGAPVDPGAGKGESEPR